MPNSSLQNKTFSIPDKVFNRVSQMLKKIKVNDKQAKGVKRANDLINNKEISYSQMKRLKHYFDNYSGDGTDDEFKLIGGTITKKWVDDTLSQDRESIKKIKKSRMDAGEENQFLKTHSKDKDNSNPTNPNGGLVDITKGSTLRNVMTGDSIYKSSDNKNEAYEKEISSIKYLIEYICKIK